MKTGSPEQPLGHLQIATAAVRRWDGLKDGAPDPLIDAAAVAKPAEHVDDAVGAIGGKRTPQPDRRDPFGIGEHRHVEYVSVRDAQ